MICDNSDFSKKDRDLIDHAIEIATKAHEGQTRKSDGGPYITHPIAVAEILCKWGADADTIIAGILHDTIEDSSLNVEEIDAEFGHEVSSLVEGVTKFTHANLEGKDSLHHEVETLRRLFEVMRNDIRVAIIKMADRLHNLRTIDGLSDERRITFAKEAIDIYYKIAFHLGMNELCREITNIAIPYIYPEKAQIRERHWNEQKVGIGKSVKKIEKEIKNEDEKNMVLGVQLIKSSHDLPRPNKSDEAADRAYYCVIIVRDIDSCYSVFKRLHELYRPVRRRFHDYIASPPESGYRSLHTTVIGPDNKTIQIRIRTTEMDQQVRYGGLRTAFGENKDELKVFSWLERSAELDSTTRESSEAFWQGLQSDIFKKSIQVTVNGDYISVPQESTALDVAYFSIGAEANKICRVCINGQEKELSTNIIKDDVIEVDLSDELQVSFKWSQIVNTKHARNQITEALKEFDRSEIFIIGQKLLQQELDHFHKKLVGEITKQEQEKISKYFQRESFEEVIIMIGEGVITPREVRHILQDGEKIKRREQTNYPFRLHFDVLERHRDDVIPQLSSLARVHDVRLGNIAMEKQKKGKFFGLRIRGRSSDKMHYADFLSSIERHSWFSSLRTMMTISQKFALTMTFIASFAFLIIDFLIFSHYQSKIITFHSAIIFLLQIALILPPIFANFHLLKLLRHHVVLLRKDRWFFGLSVIMNAGACFVIVYENIAIGLLSIIPIFAVFTFIMFFTAYKFFVTEQIFSNATKEVNKPLTKKQWMALRRRKVEGYIFRLSAVTIWGIQPLYIKYTPASEVDPLIRIFLTGIGVLCITSFAIAAKHITRKAKVKIQKLPKNILLFNIIGGYLLFTYFLNASLLHTTSTNFILFNNFSPVLALMVGALLWRASIPYLKEPKKMLWIFIVFLMGSTGSALIIYSTVKGSGGSVFGDMLGLMAMIADTVLVVSQIRYLKLFPKISGLTLNMYVFIAHVLAILPIIVWLFLTGNSMVHSLTMIPVLFGIGAGFLAGVGQILNYETFRRIDGFIAFLMFNISILITFVFEVFFLGGFAFSWILAIGGSIIIASTILAEVINSACQKKGL
ncbi:HD domain-containing protein [Candidatus Peregrinibacteria bacterium]|nr:HD domain-containing protein [Candidatus Peregrinibacteria bacterium]